MSITTVISSTMFVLITLATLFLLVRGTSMPADLHQPKLGWITLCCYLCGVLGAMLVWGRDAEGLGIASILVGMPWSALSAFVLSELLPLRTGLFGTGWETTIMVVSLGAIGINSWLAYQLGKRLSALWSTKQQSS